MQPTYNVELGYRFTPALARAMPHTSSSDRRYKLSGSLARFPKAHSLQLATQTSVTD